METTRNHRDSLKFKFTMGAVQSLNLISFPYSNNLQPEYIPLCGMVWWQFIVFQDKPTSFISVMSYCRRTTPKRTQTPKYPS